MTGQPPPTKKARYDSQYFVRQQLSTVDKAIQDLSGAGNELKTQRTKIKSDIQRTIKKFHEALEVSENELIGQLDQMTQQKLKTLLLQKAKLQRNKTQLNSCLQRPVVQQMRMCEEIDINTLSPQEQADMAFVSGCEFLPTLQQFGQVFSHPVCPEKCYATGKGLETATVGKQRSVTVHAIDRVGSKCATCLPDTSISCELVSYSTSESVKCTVRPVRTDEYKVDYQPTLRGRHQLHIQMLGQHIIRSPFAVVAIREIGAPIRTITGLRGPCGVAINERGQIIIAESSGHCISIYNPNGEKVKSFGQKGSAPGQFNSPHGLAVDRAGNILVVDEENHRVCIQKFSGDGKLMKLIRSRGGGLGQFNPFSIGISPSGKMYICDRNNHRVQILNPDPTFSGSFGSEGSGDGQCGPGMWHLTAMGMCM